MKWHSSCAVDMKAINCKFMILECRVGGQSYSASLSVAPDIERNIAVVLFLPGNIGIWIIMRGSEVAGVVQRGKIA